MCRSRTASSCRDILGLGLGEDLVAEVPAEETRRVEVHLAPEDRRQLRLHGEEGEAWNVARLELDEHIDVADG